MLADQAVQITVSADRITAGILRTVMQEYVYQYHMNSRQSSVTHGEQSLEELNAQGKQLEHVDLKDEDIQAVRQELRRYGVDFSIMKEPDSDTYHLFFKAQDIDRVRLGLEKVVKDFDRTLNRTPMEEQMKAATQEAQERNAAHDAEKAAEQAVKRAVQREAEL